MMTQHRTIALGDIHGCLEPLDLLLEQVALQDGDTLVILGDAIDRGHQSRQVIDRLLELRDRCHLVTILGNHEQMLLDVVEGRVVLSDWLIHGGAETLDSYGKGAALDKLPTEHIDFLSTWGDYHETASHFFAHGNYLPDKKLTNQPWDWLRWEPWRSLFPACHCSGKTAVVGHTADKQGRIMNFGHLVCIDTYCHGGGWLTALEAETGHVWQANLAGECRQTQLPPVRREL